MKKCETFECTAKGTRMCQVAPGTTLWLCAKCAEEIKVVPIIWTTLRPN